MSENIYRVIHAILENSALRSKIERIYAFQLNIGNSEAIHQAHKVIGNMVLKHVKPQKKSLEKLAYAIKEITSDPRSLEDIIGIIVLPYSPNLISYGTTTETQCGLLLAGYYDAQGDENKSTPS